MKNQSNEDQVDDFYTDSLSASDSSVDTNLDKIKFLFSHKSTLDHYLKKTSAPESTLKNPCYRQGRLITAKSLTTETTTSDTAYQTRHERAGTLGLIKVIPCRNESPLSQKQVCLSQHKRGINNSIVIEETPKINFENLGHGKPILTR